VLSYSAYAEQEAPGLLTSATALELLHNFILIHDDIIDRSHTRRSRPSMHALLQEELSKVPHTQYSGEHMAMIVGDMIYALGLRLFMAVEENETRKNAALAYLTQSAVYTACGELKQFIDTLQPIEKISPEAIAQTAQWKTAYYSFACPMVTGAILGGASSEDIDAIIRYALAVGLAYQIRDDIEDLLNGQNGNGKNGESELSDLRDGRRTLPLWYAFHHCTHKERSRLNAMLNGGKTSRRDLRFARDVILRSGGIDYARQEMNRCLDDSHHLLDGSAMNRDRRNDLRDQTARIFGVM
jgi:geranylgeranyl diphosphate synthase type I